MSSNGLSRTNIEKRFAKKNAEGKKKKTTDKSRNEKRSIAGIEENGGKILCINSLKKLYKFEIEVR